MEVELQQQEQTEQQSDTGIESGSVKPPEQQFSSADETENGNTVQESKRKKKDTVQNFDDKKSIIEALIFASEEPLPFKLLKEMIDGDDSSTGPKEESVNGPIVNDEESKTSSESGQENGEIVHAPKRKRPSKKSSFTPGIVKKIIDELNDEYFNSGRSFRIIEVAGGYSFQTTKEFGMYVGRMFAEKTKRRMTHSALETLAIIAFRQPISKPAIEAIRGVNADFVLKSLLEKDLVKITGRDEGVGRPLLYGTTDAFLMHFGLADLNDLPKPREIEELLEAEESIGIESIEEPDEDETESPIGIMREGTEMFDTLPVEYLPTDEDADEPLEEMDLEKLQEALENISGPIRTNKVEDNFSSEIDETQKEPETPARKDDFEFEE